MKKNILISLFLFSGIVVIAQEIDMSKFKLPEYKRNMLELNFYSNNNGGFSNSKPDTGSQFTKNPNFSIYNYANISYSTRRNSQNYQGYLAANISTTIPNLSKEWTNTASTENENVSRYMYLNFNSSSVSRFYNESEKYIEISPAISLSNSTNHYFYDHKYDNPTSNYSNEYNYLTTGFNFETDIRVGVGRVEPIEDLRQVVYIITDLQKAGRLKRELSEEEMYALAEKISVLKNKRFLDSRLRLIEETIEIEKIMKEMDLIAEYDAVFYSTVNDYWSMAGNPYRNSGSRLSIGIKPSLSHAKNGTKTETIELSPDTSYTTEYKNILNGYIVRASAYYEKFRPVNLYWQEDYNVELFTGFQNRKYNYESPVNTASENVLVSGVQGNYSLKYFPNSRTSYSCNGSLLYEFGKGEEDAYPDGTKHNLFSTELGAGTNYYFSPQLTVNASAGLSYLHQNNTSSLYYWSGYPIKDAFSVYLNISLVYKMF